jgi:hypothetical protein
MALYLISYDISGKDSAEYQPLWDLLSCQNSLFGVGCDR